MATKMTGGALIAAMLKREGVEKVFGIIDGTYLGLMAGLRTEGIELITPRHETTAVHMAAAYARLTGKMGVCIASNGPGVANALPGIAVENAEGNPVLMITSTRRTGITYPDRGGTYQYFNQVGVIKPMAKWSGSPQSFSRIPEMLRRALRILHRGRPGVVHLDVPENLLNGEDTVAPLWQTAEYRRTEALWPSEDAIERTASMLITAESPLIHAGSGIIHALAYEELKETVELLKAPLTTSWAARGVLPETIDGSIPMIYIDVNNKVRNEADVVLTLGSRLSETDWWGKAPYWNKAANQKMIQVDSDEENIGMNRPVDLAVLADVKIFLQKLNQTLKSENHAKALAAKRSQRQERIQKYEKEKQNAREKLDKELNDKSSPLNPAHVGSICRQFFNDDAIVVFDGGNTAIWGNFYFEARHPGTILSTFKFGMLGAGVAQALAAGVAFPGRQVYCLIGDGAFGFHPQEVETAVRNQLKVIYLVFCDKQWGMVKMTQQFAFRPIKTMIKKSLDKGETINADLNEIRFDLLAESMGAHGDRVSTVEQLLPALERCENYDGPSVIHVDVNPVKHMWAPGLMAFKDMHKEPSGK